MFRSTPTDALQYAIRRKPPRLASRGIFVVLPISIGASASNLNIEAPYLPTPPRGMEQTSHSARKGAPERESYAAMAALNSSAHGHVTTGSLMQSPATQRSLVAGSESSQFAGS